ncbi:MAG TPA: SprT family zinc-dependent metalloprotease [Williamwhitmania sp.]|nr:SprT family zinc-dependent metalloprotease [Williamwhitmania sp.]
MEKTIEHPQLGTITLRKRRGLKRISIRVDIRERVILSMPYSVATSAGLNFISAKLEWIQKSLITIRTKKNEHPTVTIGDGYKTRTHTLILVPETRKNIRAVITAEAILFHYPEGASLETEAMQHSLKSAIVKTLTLEAKALIPSMVSATALQHGLRYNMISVKNIHSRWGSCSSKNNLNFSIYLVLLPESLIQYVILHELCHTLQKNHGGEFWKLLDAHCGGNAKLLAKEMKKYTTRIF